LGSGHRSGEKHEVMKISNNYALVDCNSFYVSCERLFRPDLLNKPVVVLSNNDGCVVSRSQEAKNIGVGMGVPYFQIRDLLKRHDGHSFSSNYEFYADMSNRVMTVLKEYSPDLEIYSIDEAFLHLNYLQGTNYVQFADEIKLKIFRETGIPVSVGIAKTKTLAKAANELCKRNAIFAGSLSFIDLDQEQINEYLKMLPVGEVWGVGRKSALKLQTMGVKTAYDLQNTSEQTIKQLLTVTSMRTALELKGQPCYELESAKQAQSVVVSRSFGHLATKITEIKESLSTHIMNGAKRLRNKKLNAQYLTIFMHTNPHRKQDKQYFISKTISLNEPSNYHGDFISLALQACDELFKEGFLYKKAGVVFTGLTSIDKAAQNLFTSNEATLQRKNCISKVMDAINAKYGQNSLVVASMGLKQNWVMKREMRSNRFTTNWNELVSIS